MNFVWNYCADVQRQAMKWQRKWPSHFDLTYLTAGSSAELGIHADTIGDVCRQFTASRNASRRCPRWRSNKKSLGWIPLRSRAFQLDGDTLVYRKRRYRFWKSREIIGDVRGGSISQDARGRWYLNLWLEVDEVRPTGDGVVGIDLGLKVVAVCSNGYSVPALQHYRRYELALGAAQRARKTRRVTAINAKIANARKHHLHIHSAIIARENKLIVVGNVSAAQMGKTRMAKSVYDAGWATLRAQLHYKALRHGAAYIEADERFTSQTCSACGCIPASSPKGTSALGIRSWVCSDCGEVHDRDLNAARNILRIGLERQTPTEGALAA